MPIAKELLENLDINPEFKRPLADWVKRWPLYKRTDILVVVDTEISTNSANDFGIARVIALLRAAKVGCLRFNVDIALRNGESPSIDNAPAPTAPKYRGFRFNMLNGAVPVINKYEQIWCFGFKPSNSGNPSDAEIDMPSSFPASDEELAELARWMKDQKGGLFGTGDHHFLGASMCRRIPRLGVMRRWTNADGVPPIGGPDRIDTLRPPSPNFEPGAPGGPQALNNSPHQGDLVVQPIRWTTWQFSFWPFGFRKRPHPVLCHPTLGPIDVMPDHAHEGLCVETADIPASATFDFDDTGDKPMFPDSITAGPKPMPTIIAYGSTLGDPPFNFGKGPQPARSSFAMISVYDGHQAGVGRVATDSTWHHWMDVNINTIATANTEDWQKISRYYINLAVWLNPPGVNTHCLWLDVITSHFETVGLQEFHDQASVQELGASLRRHLAKRYGPCWVTERIWEIIWERKLWPWDVLKGRQPKQDFGGIDPDVIEDLVLGHFVKATIKPAMDVKLAAADRDNVIKEALAIPDKLFTKPLQVALKELAEGLTEHFDMGLKIAKAMK